MNDAALARLAVLERETARLDERTEALEAWQKRQNGSLQRLEEHMERMDAKLDSHVERLDAKLDERVEEINEKLTARLQSVDKRIAEIDERIQELCIHVKENIAELQKAREADRKAINDELKKVKEDTRESQIRLLYWVLGILGAPVVAGVVIYFINTFSSFFAG